MLTEVTGERMFAKEWYSGETLFSNILKVTMVKTVEKLCREELTYHLPCCTQCYREETKRTCTQAGRLSTLMGVPKAPKSQIPQRPRMDTDPCSLVPTVPWLEQRSGSSGMAVLEHRWLNQTLFAAQYSLSKESQPGCASGICSYW